MELKVYKVDNEWLLVDGRTVVAHVLPLSDDDDGARIAAMFQQAPLMLGLLERILDRISMGFGRLPSAGEISDVVLKAKELGEHEE